jgi:ATP-dependent RNA helicase DDX35
VAEEMGVDLGKECGYSIRFENKADAERTRVKFLTDGILLREMMSDPLLSRYSVVMVDEAHERSIYTDVVVGLLKKIQRRRRDLRVIIASATLDAEAFKNFFLGDKPDVPPPFPDGTLGRVAVLSMAAGRIYPVDVHYLCDPTQDYLKSCLETVLQIHMKEPPGDILVFLTGADEVTSLTQTIHELGGKGWQGLTLTATPLFGALPIERQLEAFGDSSSSTRKVVVATNIAETSVTIPGIVYVVDRSPLSQPRCCQLNLCAAG